MLITASARFDIYSFDFGTEEDEKSMLESVGHITELIKYEIKASGIEPSRVVLGGFSQCAAMLLLTGLTYEHHFAGLAVLSGRLPLRHKFKEMASQNASSTPIFWATGSDDQLVKVELVNESVDFVINELGIPRAKPDQFGGLSYNVYEGLGHSTEPNELGDFKVFIKNAIPSN